MTIPAFFSRVADALRPVAEVPPDVLADKLERGRIHIDVTSMEPGAHAAFLLASNLAARLYPRIDLSPLKGSAQTRELSERARELILRINPEAHVTIRDEDAAQKVAHGIGTERAAAADAHRDDDAFSVLLVLGPRVEVPKRRHGPTTDAPLSIPAVHVIQVAAMGWSVVVDPPESFEGPLGPDGEAEGHPLAWLAAASIGIGEVFRAVFATELGDRGRTMAQPGGFDLLTAQPVDMGALPRVSPLSVEDGPIDLGEVHLIGAGAIGQATALALSHVNARGVLHVVDPETVTLSNLQRYVLTGGESVGAVKANMIGEALTGASHDGSARADELVAGGDTDHQARGLEVRPFQGRWGDVPHHLEAEQVLVALDTAKDRIVVAATQPRHAFNAWTQVADLGWSRHEDVGVDPCLACLYYPSSVRPHDHELIASALKESPLRVLAYLIYNLPIGYPLPGVPAVPDLPAPPEAAQWTQVALIEDLLAAGVIGEAERNRWADMTVGALYRDGICAGGLLPVGDLPGEAIVPLAHQSALAGIMLAAELVWSRSPELRVRRDAFVEHRYDVLRGFPQVIARPRQRTSRCLCEDPQRTPATPVTH